MYGEERCGGDESLLRFAMRESWKIFEVVVLVKRESDVRGKEKENEVELVVVWLCFCRERCMKEKRKKKRKCVFDEAML